MFTDAFFYRRDAEAQSKVFAKKVVILYCRVPSCTAGWQVNCARCKTWGL